MKNLKMEKKKKKMRKWIVIIALLFAGFSGSAIPRSSLNGSGTMWRTNVQTPKHYAFEYDGVNRQTHFQFSTFNFLFSAPERILYVDGIGRHYNLSA